MPRLFRRFRARRPLPVTISQILSWADSYYAQNGTWPNNRSGHVFENRNENWSAIDNALRKGTRGLEPGSSLPRLLYRKRGVPYQMVPAALTIPQILVWSDEHYRRKKAWPTAKSGQVLGRRNETWSRIDSSLRYGLRGLKVGSSMARLLARERGVPNHRGLALLTENQIVTWARLHHRRTGSWPQGNSGPISGTRGEVWSRIRQSLKQGSRGLPGGDSLGRLLARHFGAKIEVLYLCSPSRQSFAGRMSISTKQASGPRLNQDPYPLRQARPGRVSIMPLEMGGEVCPVALLWQCFCPSTGGFPLSPFLKN